jgi:hypothetical protein
MAKIHGIDRDLGHLYPPFREKLALLLNRVGERTGRRWGLVEGYRSRDRQLYLYGQGRPELGAGPPFYGRKGPKVTWMRTPKFHGTGTAADCAPLKKVAGVYTRLPDYKVPHQFWLDYRAVWRELGFSNPAWDNGDYQHVQISSLAQMGAQWVRSGFRGVNLARGLPPVQAESVELIVDGQTVYDAEAYVKWGTVYAWLRPFCDALDVTILATAKWERAHRATLLWDDGNPNTSLESGIFTVPIEVTDGKGMVKVRDLALVLPHVKLQWEGPLGKLLVTTKGAP